MTADPIFCPAQTFAQTRDNPEEFCDELVAEEGDFCPLHDEPDDDYCHERYLEDKAEREADPDYYTDHGDF